MGREARGYLERSWCEEEFRSVELGDRRLKSRLIKTAEKLSEQPSQPINQACESWADTKAAYRLFQNQKFAAAEIIKTHAERTKRRGECFDVLIAATDKSYLSFESHPRTTGLGLIGSNQKQHSHWPDHAHNSSGYSKRPACWDFGSEDLGEEENPVEAKQNAPGHRH